jgi:TRAP-type C4-dicarboxylate transport system permease small subunit
MRVYLSPAITKLLSTTVVILSVGIMLYLGWKAFITWQQDPSLQQIQELIKEKEE